MSNSEQRTRQLESGAKKKSKYLTATHIPSHVAVVYKMKYKNIVTVRNDFLVTN